MLQTFPVIATQSHLKSLAKFCGNGAEKALQLRLAILY